MANSFRNMLAAVGVLLLTPSDHLGAATNTWQKDLARIVIPTLELRDATLTDAIGQINRAAAEADTNGVAPVVTVDLTPTTVVVTNLATASALDRYRDELVARWKQRHAYFLEVSEPGLVSVALRNVRADSAIKIVSQRVARYTRLQDRDGKPVLGYDRDWLLECRAYSWPSRSAAATKFRRGLDGADDLEMAFDSGTGPPLHYTMMLAPATNLLLVVAEPSEQRRIRGRLDAVLSGEAGPNSRPVQAGSTPALPETGAGAAPAFSGTTDE